MQKVDINERGTVTPSMPQPTLPPNAINALKNATKCPKLQHLQMQLLRTLPEAKTRRTEDKTRRHFDQGTVETDTRLYHKYQAPFYFHLSHRLSPGELQER